MKNITIYINESKDTWLILNNSAIKGNKSYEKLAKQAGVKYNDEWWFVSAGFDDESKATEEIEKVKADYDKSNKEFPFALCKVSDLQENYSKFK